MIGVLAAQNQVQKPSPGGTGYFVDDNQGTHTFDVVLCPGLKMISTYTGALCQVQRPQDNATQDLFAFVDSGLAPGSLNENSPLLNVGDIATFSQGFPLHLSGIYNQVDGTFEACDDNFVFTAFDLPFQVNNIPSVFMGTNAGKLDLPFFEIQNRSLFIVANPFPSDSTSRLLHSSDSAGNNQFYFRYRSNDDILPRFGDTGARSYFATPLNNRDTPQLQLISIIMQNDSNCKIYHNFNLENEFIYSLDPGSTGVDLEFNSDGGDRNMQGLFCCLLILTEGLTGTTLDNFQNNLGQIWGLNS